MLYRKVYVTYRVLNCMFFVKESILLSFAERMETYISWMWPKYHSQMVHTSLQSASLQNAYLKAVGILNKCGYNTKPS